MKTRDDITAQRVAEAGQLYRTIMLKAYSGEASPRQAIKAMCLHCMGYDREAIKTCTGYSCPLWEFRGYK